MNELELNELFLQVKNDSHKIEECLQAADDFPETATYWHNARKLLHESALKMQRKMGAMDKTNIASEVDLNGDSAGDAQGRWHKNLNFLLQCFEYASKRATGDSDAIRIYSEVIYVVADTLSDVYDQTLEGYRAFCDRQ